MNLDDIEDRWNIIQTQTDCLLDTAHFAWSYVPKLIAVAKEAEKLTNGFRMSSFASFGLINGQKQVVSDFDCLQTLRHTLAELEKE